MAETTSYETEMDREAVASYLRSIADELDGEPGTVRTAFFRLLLPNLPAPGGTATSGVDRDRRAVLTLS